MKRGGEGGPKTIKMLMTSNLEGMIKALRQKIQTTEALK